MRRVRRLAIARRAARPRGVVPDALDRVGEIGELMAAHAEKGITASFAVLPDPTTTSPNTVFSIKDCMLDGNYDYLLM